MKFIMFPLKDILDKEKYPVLMQELLTLPNFKKLAPMITEETQMLSLEVPNEFTDNMLFQLGAVVGTSLSIAQRS